MIPQTYGEYKLHLRTGPFNNPHLRGGPTADIICALGWMQAYGVFQRPPSTTTLVTGRLGSMVPGVEQISAVTFQVTNMQVSVRFYRDVLGMELIFGGEDSHFSSLQASESESAILNLEKGPPVMHWGRLILHVTDVDAFWTHLNEKGFDPEPPRDGAWGERYFHLRDPDGHELSFARPLRSAM